MKKAVVTGACGFIGSNIVKELLANDYFVYAIIRKEEEIYADFRKDSRVRLFYYDMDEYLNLKQEENLAESDILFHFSWAGVADEFSRSYAIQLNNVKHSCDLLESAIQLKIKKFVFAGSIMEYEHIKAIQSGYYNVSKRNVYHIAKIAARNMLQVIANNSNIYYQPITISNVFGPGDRSNRLINQLIKSIINHEILPLTPCEQKYDFMYINDAAQAIRLVGELGSANKNYYIGNQSPRVLKDYIYEIYKTLGSMSPLGIGKRDLLGISLDYTEFDTLGIYEDLGFIAGTSFSQGIMNTKEWIEKNLLFV